MSLVTTLRPPSAIYREEQNFAWWLYAVLLALAVNGVVGLFMAQHAAANGGIHHWGGTERSLAVLGLTFPPILIVGLLRMTTEVTPNAVRVWFGWLPSYRRAISLADIRSVEAVTYRPLVDCGGWGIRRGRGGEKVLNARGNRGVRLTLIDGSKLLIGSQKPEELAGALQRAMQPDD